MARRIDVQLQPVVGIHEVYTFAAIATQLYRPGVDRCAPMYNAFDDQGPDFQL